MTQSVIQEYENKISLLDQYSKALEKQNFAKNQQTSLIYEQLESFKQENQMLKSIIENLNRREDDRNMMEPNNLRWSSQDFQQDLRRSSTVESFKKVAEEMKQQLQKKQGLLNQYMTQNNQYLGIIKKLQKQLNNAKQRITNSQQKVRKGYKKIKCLQQTNYELKTSLDESRNVSFCRLQVDRLVKENNELIQKIRMLEKEKNIYYTQLKSVSPMKGAHQPSQRQNTRPLLEHSRSKLNNKNQRWNVIEEKLKQIRQQNQQLKANLSIY